MGVRKKKILFDDFDISIRMTSAKGSFHSTVSCLVRSRDICHRSFSITGIWSFFSYKPICRASLCGVVREWCLLVGMGGGAGCWVACVCGDDDGCVQYQSQLFTWVKESPRVHVSRKHQGSNRNAHEMHAHVSTKEGVTTLDSTGPSQHRGESRNDFWKQGNTVTG